MHSLAQPGLDVASVVPVFIPSTFIVDGSWPGPYEPLPADRLALAWAILTPGHSTQYVLRETQQRWETEGIDWRTQALENLRERSADPCGAAALFRENSETWLISLKYADGLGSSRLLLADRLQSVFPKGYRVAAPELNRAFAFAAHLDDEERDMLQNLIHRSYSRSEQPLSPEILEPHALFKATPKSNT